MTNPFQPKGISTGLSEASEDLGVSQGILKDQVLESFRDTYAAEPHIIVRAPGRVNLLGAHVDYNDGWVLPAAVDRAIWLAAAGAADSTVRIKALNFDGAAEFNLQDLINQRLHAEMSDAEGDWINYPAGVAWALQDAGHPLKGMNVVFAGDIPIGAGMSSSAAVEVAFILAWETLSDLRLSSLDRARLGQRAENQYMGVASGIMDQFASVHGKANKLILLDCRTLDHELITLPAGTAILVGDTGVRRALANSEYNMRRAQCEEALAILQQSLPGIRALRDVSIDDFRTYAHLLPEVLRLRAQHVVEECTRVLEGVEALRKGNLLEFGRAIQRSHASSRDLYEVSIPELNVLAESASKTEGCYGARLSGAGFGGCVVALVAREAAAHVGHNMMQAFAARFGRIPSLFLCRVTDGATAELHEQPMNPALTG